MHQSENKTCQQQQHTYHPDRLTNRVPLGGAPVLVTHLVQPTAIHQSNTWDGHSLLVQQGNRDPAEIHTNNRNRNTTTEHMGAKQKQSYSVVTCPPVMTPWPGWPLQQWPSWSACGQSSPPGTNLTRSPSSPAISSLPAARAQQQSRGSSKRSGSSNAFGLSRYKPSPHLAQTSSPQAAHTRTPCQPEFPGYHPQADPAWRRLVEGTHSVGSRRPPCQQASLPLSHT